MAVKLGAVWMIHMKTGSAVYTEHASRITPDYGYSPMLTPPILYLAQIKAIIYNLTTLCLNGTLPYVDFLVLSWEICPDYCLLSLGVFLSFLLFHLTEVGPKMGKMTSKKTFEGRFNSPYPLTR